VQSRCADENLFIRALEGSLNEHLPVSYNVAHSILSSITGQCPITAGAGAQLKVPRAKLRVLDRFEKYQPTQI